MPHAHGDRDRQSRVLLVRTRAGHARIVSRVAAILGPRLEYPRTMSSAARFALLRVILPPGILLAASLSMRIARESFGLQ